ncbi:MAG: clostripain-related cysteine peptidase [Clostridia bacterium]|nr:clostripain-related cysteine peptidase [Clostridia bacterium]
MGNHTERNWTVLIYANGNNELEPEVYKAFKDLERASFGKDVAFAMEIGREDREVARIIRPYEKIPHEKDIWTGVRRYEFSQRGAQLVNELGKVNMADPESLYAFIKWGMERKPAKHYMLVIGGHGACYVGVMTDLSQEKPYIMKTVEMCGVINRIYKDTGNFIDILLLDACYMNYIEVMYELGVEPEPAVRYVLTYMGEGPFEGMPYDKIVNIIENLPNNESSKVLLKKMIDTVNLNLAAFHINPPVLKEIKRLYSFIAKKVIDSGWVGTVNPERIVQKLENFMPWYNEARELRGKIESVVVYREKSNACSFPLNIISFELKGLMEEYLRFGFTKENDWVRLVYRNKRYCSSKCIGKKDSIREKEDELILFILPLNPGMDLKATKSIYDKLIAYKGWRLK